MILKSFWQLGCWLIFLAFSYLGISGLAQKKGDRPPLPSDAEIRQLPKDGGPRWNRLIFESSPYLLQHAANPVDWYPWGEAAFEKARLENKPVFLSIGYSTCHWCHVMEHESFEDKEVAALLNRDFIAIKVDREERPDIDEIYMAACQLMTGGGGWPLTVFLSADKKPFFAGTYFPKEGRYGRPGMMALLPRVVELWQKDRATLQVQSQKLTQAMQQQTQFNGDGTFGDGTLAQAYREMAGRYDANRGGFGQAPKFPSPHNFLFLLRYWKRSGDAEALNMVRTTLLAMRKGGIYDHIGFGFHRYSTDANWLLPHFEKMLYDQAMLAMAYLEAYQATGEPLFAQTAREIFTYVLRDMTSSEGGFFSAEDADSEGEEGRFYYWTIAEVEAVIGKKEGQWLGEVFNLKPKGNFVEQGQQGPPRSGHNIFHLQKTWTEIAKEADGTPAALSHRWATARQKLFMARERRVHPIKDDKILTDWNGLMIAALAKGANILNEPAYARAAEKAADFLLSKLTGKDGRLLKRYRKGQAGLPAYLDDYAYLTWGLLELYEVNFKVGYLQKAVDLNQIALTLYWDPKGGFFQTASDHEKLIFRPKSIYDGAIPSGNSVAALNLLRLGRMTANTAYDAKAEALLKTFAGQLQQRPSTSNFLMSALDFATGPTFEVVLVGDLNGKDFAIMKNQLHQNFVPNKVVIHRSEDTNPAIVALAPYTKDQLALEGKATAYVCQNYACKRPTTDPRQMVKHLGVVE